MVMTVLAKVEVKKIVISKVDLAILRKNGSYLIQVSITDGKRLIFHYIGIFILNQWGPVNNIIPIPQCR